MPARLPNDPMRYIRRVKNGMYQARPYDDGERYNLGLFPTWSEAARAIQEFWRHGAASWYKGARLKFVRQIQTKTGTVYSARVVIPLPERYQTAEEAHQAAIDFLRKHFDEAAVQKLLQRK